MSRSFPTLLWRVGVVATIALVALILGASDRADAATLTATNAGGVNVSRQGCLETMPCGAGFSAGLGGDDFEPQIATDGGVTGGVDYSQYLIQTWSHFTTKSASLIYFSTSPDGGQTWTAPARLPDQPSLTNKNDDSRIYIDRSTHTIYVTYLTYNANFSKGDIYLARSTDQGATWTYTQVNTAQANLNTSCGTGNGQQGCGLHQVVASGSNVWVAMGPSRQAGSRHYIATSSNSGGGFSVGSFGGTASFVQPVAGSVQSNGTTAWFMWGDCSTIDCSVDGGGTTSYNLSRTVGTGGGATSSLYGPITTSQPFPNCTIPNGKGGCSVDGVWGAPATFGMDANNNMYMAYMNAASSGAAPTIQWRYCLAANIATTCGPTATSGWTAGAQVSDTPAGFYAIQPRLVVRGPDSVGVTWFDDRNGSTTACVANTDTNQGAHTCGWRVYYRATTTATSAATGWGTTKDMWAYNALTDSETAAGLFWPYADTGAPVIQNAWAGDQPMVLWAEASRYLGNQGHMLLGTPAAHAPTNLNAAGGFRQVQLSWTASAQTNAGAITYRVYRGTTPTDISTLVANVAGTSYTDTGATSDLTTYYYKVYAVSSTNGVGFPAQASAMTQDTNAVTFDHAGLAADSIGTVLTVNGVNYTYANLPVTLNLPPGTQVNYLWAGTVNTTGGNRRYQLTTPAPSPASPFTLNSYTTVTATYGTQVRVTFAAPAITSGADTASATVFSVGGVDRSASSLGSATWYDTGTAWSFADPVATTNPDKRYKISSATSGTLASGDAGVTKTGSYGVQWRPTFSVTGIGADTGNNTVVTIGGTAYKASDLPVTDWHSDGAAWSYATPVSTSPASGKQYRRTSGASGSVTSATGVTGTYVTQYQVTFGTTGIGGDTGANTVATIGGTGYSAAQLPVTSFFDSGTSYSFASPISTSPPSSHRYRRSSAPGGSVGASDAGTTITGTYVTQYQVTFAAAAITSGGDTGGSTVFSVGGTGFDATGLGSAAFYDSGAAWSFASPVSAGADKRYVLASPTGGTIGLADAGSTKSGNYGAQYQVTFSVTGIGGDTGSNAVLSVGGTNRSLAQLPLGPSWFDSGTPYSWFTPVNTSPASAKVYNLTSAPAASTITTGGSVAATYDAYDPATPNTAIDSGPSPVTLATDATFTFSSDQPGSTFECRLDGGAWTSCTSPKTYNGLAVGPHTFEVRATAGGVTDPAPPSRAWVIADVIPETTITSGPPNVTEDTSATFEFTSDQPGSTFECRLDGGAWTSCATPKTYNSLALGPHAFEVRAIYNGIADTSPPSRAWSVEEIVPVTQIDGGPPSLTTSTDSSFTFSADQPGSTFECRVDGGAWAACTSPRNLTSVALGTHEFEVRATFNGITDPAPPSRSWTVVAVIPATQIDNGPPSTTTSTSATFEFSSTPATTTFECRIDGGAWEACATPKTYNGLALGPHTFQVRAMYNGVTDPDPALRGWTIVPVVPDTQIDSGPSGSTTSTDATFAFSSDQPGSTFECRLDAGAWGACVSPKGYSGLGIATHTFDVRATLGGQTDPTPAARTWTVESPVPATQIDSGPSGTTTSTDATFAFSSDQPGATFECRLDAGAWGACVSPKGYSGLGIATHTFDVRAVLGGVKDPNPASRTWTVEAVVPSTQIDGGPTGNTTSRNASFDFSSDHPSASFECRIDGGGWEACVSPHSYIGLSVGSHTFDVRAVLDGVKDPSPATRTWGIDSVVPGTQIVTGPLGTTTSQTATFTFSSDHPSAAFECRIDGGAWTACSSPIDYLMLAIGPHNFDVRAVLDGIKDPSPPSRSWLIVAPSPTSISIKAPVKVRRGAKVRVSGVLDSTDAACVNAQPLSLKKGAKVVQSKNTTSTGTYRFVLKIRKKTVVRVEFAGTSSCQASASKARTIRIVT